MARISLREAAYAAMADRLRQDIPTVPLERNRRSLLNDGEAPLLVLRDGSQQPGHDGAGEDLLTIEGVVEGYLDSSDEEIGAEISQLAGEVAEALTREPIIPAARLDGGVEVEITVLEGRMDIQIETVSQSQTAIGAFFLDFTFDLRVPSGTRFLETP